MSVQPILLAGQWRESTSTKTFHATNPKTTEPIPEEYPVSGWAEVEAAISAARVAQNALREVSGPDRARFLETFADRIEARCDELVQMASAETALPAEPRLASVELPRTANQLRQAASAARDGSWQMLTIDTETNIRSRYESIGPVCVFGPNNFPFAFNSAAGGDFAAAIAAGNCVIAKANSSHPGTTRLLAEEAHAAAQKTDMPASVVQLLYRLDHADGERLVAHPHVGATGYTGSRAAGLALKSAADAAGKPIYLELSSINPVVVLPGALGERSEQIADEFKTSCLMGTGQFCTNPGLVLLLKGAKTDEFVSAVAQRFGDAPVGTLLGPGVAASLKRNVEALIQSGAQLVTGGQEGGGAGFSHQNTLLRTTGKQFLEHAQAMQTETFGNESLVVVCDDREQLWEVIGALEGNLTGCIYSHSGDEEEDLYAATASLLLEKVGRLLNDKMPTGVAVVPSMNHGGPYPATGHPGFTAVGLPASMLRFAALRCYDNVREKRLPRELHDHNATNTPWRLIDGVWTRGDAT